MTTAHGTPAPHQLVERALEIPGADDRVVVARVTEGVNLRWANNTLTTNGSSTRCHVTVLSYRRRSDGVAVAAMSGTAVTHEQVAALVSAADAVADRSRPAPDAFPLVEGGPDPGWGDGAPPAPGIGLYADLASGLGESFGRARSEGRILYGFADHELTTTYLGSTTGVRRRHVQPTGHWGCTAKPADLTSSAWVGGATRDFRDVDAAAMDAVLAQRLQWARRRVDLSPGRYDTVLPATAVADLMIYAYWCAGDRAARDGQSAYGRAGGGTRIGERLSRHDVDLLSDPHHPGLEADPFVTVAASDDDASVFDNGVPLRGTAWIEAGTLRNLVRPRHAAAAHGDEPAPAIDNLVMRDRAGAGDVTDLVAGVERGLLLTCLWYIREVDPATLLLTGLTRDGVYLVENGEVTGEVNNFRFNESPVGVLGRATEAGRTEKTLPREWSDWFTRAAMPALRVPDFNMSSVSQGV
jgi:predicted Zn-dependent protease